MAMSRWWRGSGGVPERQADREHEQRGDVVDVHRVEDAISPPAEMHEIAVLLAKSGDDAVALVEIDHSGHMTTMENPAAVTAAIAAFAKKCYGL